MKVFNKGDKVKINYSNNKEDGEYIGYSPIYYNFHLVKCLTGIYKNMDVLLQDNEIELSKPLPTATSGMTITVNNPMFGSGIYRSSQMEEELYQIKFGRVTFSSTETPKHTCTFKTYTGLTYKEDYCTGCDAKKNKRGIYDA